jgi:hypothetical protein
MKVNLDLQALPKFGLADTRTLKRWLASGYATSPLVAFFFSFHLTFTGWLANNAIEVIPGLNPQLQDLITCLFGSIVVVTTGRLTRKWQIQPLLKVVVIWLLGAISGGLGLLSLSVMYTGEIDPELIPVAANGLISVPLLFATYTLLVASWAETKLAISSLTKHREALIGVATFVESEITSTRKSLQSQVLNELDPIVNELKQSFEKLHLNQEKLHLSEKLLDQVDQVVRPLSWQLAITNVETPNQENNLSRLLALKEQTAPKKFALSSFLTRLSNKVSPANLVAPGLNAAIYVLFLTPVAAIIFGEVGAFAAVATSALVYFGLVAFARVFVDLRINSFLAILLSSTFGILISLTFVAIIFFADRSADRYLILLSSAVMSISTLLIAVFQIVEFNRINLLHEISKINSKIEEDVNHLQQSERVLRKYTSRFVHGKVQSKLLAIALKLRNASDLDQSLLDNAKEDLDQIIESIENASISTASDFDFEFNKLVQGWAGVVEICQTRNSKFPPNFATDQVAVESALEVIGEAVSNAVKHGAAQRIDIQFDYQSPELLTIQVINQIDSGMPSELIPSYGSQVFDAITTNWSRQILGDQFKLTASIKVLS